MKLPIHLYTLVTWAGVIASLANGFAIVRISWLKLTVLLLLFIILVE